MPEAVPMRNVPPLLAASFPDPVAVVAKPSAAITNAAAASHLLLISPTLVSL
jgi:hypothetical protein